MRCLNRNKQKIWYANYTSRTEILDENENRTGQYSVEHSKPKALLANISAARGTISTEQFGDDELYDRVLIHDDPALEIDEASILWVDIVPKLDSRKNLAVDDSGEVITPHDYIVKHVARSLNSISIAISKVNVRG